MKTPIGIVGVTGYAGQELLRILLRHPTARVSYLASRRLRTPADSGVPGLKILPWNAKEAARRCELLFLALPNGEALKLVPSLLKDSDLRIIDFSGDFRQSHKAVYGLPELNRETLPGRRLVANPGCYPTASLLALAPLAEKKLLVSGQVIVDAKSGVTGAGRSAKEELLFCEVNEDFRAYKVDRHAHVPEMEHKLGLLAGRKVSMTFVPHLAPLNRGLYATIYVTFRRRIGEKTLRGLYEARYKEEPFIRILPKGSWPQVKSVAGTNRCEIALHLDPSGQRAVILSTIDNLGKGAAGQAVQNMNLLLGVPETAALLPSGG